MKRTLVLAISILVAAAPLAAQHGGGSPKPQTPHGAPAPKTTTHAQAPKATTHVSAPKATTHAAGHTTPKTTVHVSSVKPIKPVKTTTTVKPVKTTVKPVKTTTAKPVKVTSKSDKTPTTKAAKAARPAPTATTIVTTTTLSPVQQKLQRNTNLASKLQSRLPAGTNLNLASSGFRNLGQFVAAVNVSNNLGIPFWQLKTRMVDQGMSLGQAIQDTRPRTTDTVVVVHRAETDADDLIRTTEQTTAKSRKPAKSTRGEQ